MNQVAHVCYNRWLYRRLAACQPAPTGKQMVVLSTRRVMYVMCVAKKDKNKQDIVQMIGRFDGFQPARELLYDHDD